MRYRKKPSFWILPKTFPSLFYSFLTGAAITFYKYSLVIRRQLSHILAFQQLKHSCKRKLILFRIIFNYNIFLLFTKIIILLFDTIQIFFNASMKSRTTSMINAFFISVIDDREFHKIKVLRKTCNLFAESICYDSSNLSHRVILIPCLQEK